MIDQITIGDKSSFDDFSASVAERHISQPKKKSIKETVPYSNTTYDFSAINGETYWEERDLEYVFEIIAADAEELEELKTAFAGWVMNISGAELHDPVSPDYHYLATYEDMKPEDDEYLDKSTITVTFKAYPYKIANTPRVLTFSDNKLTATPYRVLNGSHHPVPAKLKVEFDSDDANKDNIVVVKIGGNTESLSAGVEYELRDLPVGLLEVRVAGIFKVTAATYTLTLSFFEEVF